MQVLLLCKRGGQDKDFQRHLILLEMSQPCNSSTNLFVHEDNRKTLRPGSKKVYLSSLGSPDQIKGSSDTNFWERPLAEIPKCSDYMPKGIIRPFPCKARVMGERNASTWP